MAQLRNSKKRKPNPAHDNPTSADDEQAEGTSQEEEVTDHLLRAQELLNNSRKRREAKRHVFETEYSGHIEKAHAKIESHREETERKISKLQVAQWDQLSALLKEREAIESVIISHMKTVEQATLNLSSELSAMYEGRLEDILELNTTGKVAVCATTDE